MKLLRQLRTLFRKDGLDAEMAEEMRLHLELQAERNVAAGMDADEARYAARRQFGGVEQIKERCREQRSWVWLEQAWQDFRYAWRALGKTPGFTLAAVGTLALGMGVNAATFSYINDLLLQPSLRDRRGHLVALHTARVGPNRQYRPFNFAEFSLLRTAHGTFADVAAMQFSTCLVGEAADVQRRLICLVSENYFALLGVRPRLGRFFSAEEAAGGADAPVVVAGYDLWQQHGGRADFVGSQVRIDGDNYTVIGVAPAGFGGLHWSHGPAAWVPLGRGSAMTGLWGGRQGNGGVLDPRWFVLQLFGNLRPGLTIAAANAQLAPLNARLNALTNAGAAEVRELTLSPPSRFNIDLTWPIDESGIAVYAAAAVGMTITVLLIACLNVANMLFGRGIARQKEISIRLCLGASRGRVVRQLLVEGFLLATAGAVGGLLLSRWSNQLLLEIGGRHSGAMTMHLTTTFNGPLLSATFALGLLATIVVSLAPALRATRRNLVDDLKKQGGEPVRTGRWTRFFSPRHCLVMTQIALSLLLLVSAGLLVRSVLMAEADRGFETDGAVIANLDYYLGKTPRETVPARQRSLLERARRLPGVADAALASAVPFNFESNNRRVFAVGAGAGDRGATDETGENAGSTIVSHRYFATMGIALLRGREFTEGETWEGSGRRVAIIDESLGRALFGDGDPVGRHVAFSKAGAAGDRGERELEIVGVVRSPREDAFQSARAFRRIYRPLGQVPDGMLNTYLHVRLARSASVPALVAALRRDVQAVDPQTPLLVCEPLATFVGKNLNVWTVRLLAILFAVFGLIAVVLAVVGVYGVKAYLIARRTQEIGIRIALGARSRDVLRLLLQQSGLQTAVGILAGLALAAPAGLGLSKLFYRVNPTDGAALGGAVALLATVSMLACLIPAWRATRINPTEALRTE